MYRLLFALLFISCGSATAGDRSESQPLSINTPVYTFPLAHAAEEPYTEGSTAFGADRDGGARLHAGCDLITAIGTPVYAVDEGTVTDFYYFYSGTYAIEVQHTNFIVRYGKCLVYHPE